MVHTLRFLSPLAGSIALMALFACGKIDTPNLVDPYANVTGKSLGFDVDPPLFEKGLDSATRGACGNILLQWTPVTDAVNNSSNILYYIYQASAPGAEDFNSPPTYQTAQFNLSSFLVKNLSPATPYYFVVRAVDEAGNLSVINPNSLVERSVPTYGTRGVGPGPNLYCPGGYAGDTAVLAGTSVAASTTVSFAASPLPVSVSATQVSNSEIRAIVPANIQSGTIQVNPPGGPATEDTFLFFPPGLNISNNVGFSTTPAIAVSGSTIGMVWTDSYDGTGSGGGVILFSYSVDDGQTFSAPPLPLSDPDRVSSTPHISFGPGSPPAVYVVWTDLDSTSNHSDIYFSRSMTGSLTGFVPPANLSANLGASLHPRVTSSGSSVSVAWDDQTGSQGEIFFIQSPDGGQNFGTPIILSSASLSGRQAEMPELVQSGNNLTIAWQETLSGIHVIQSADGGLNFSPAVISPYPSPSVSLTYPRGQKLTLDGVGNIFMVWEDTSLSPAQIRMVKFPDNNLPDFISSVTLSDSGNFSNPPANPSITAAGNRVIVAWVDLAQQKFSNNSFQNEIFLISSPDGGASFTPPVNFSSPFLFSSDSPTLVNDGSGTILMAWQQFGLPTGSPFEKSEVLLSRF